MASVTQPLRDEHKELLPLLERVRVAADAVGTGAGFNAKLDGAYDFLAGHLLPHATAEEAALYPVVARTMGSTDATKTMQMDHTEVHRLTEELGRVRNALGGAAPSDAQSSELRALLYGLYTLVSVHFEKEEQVYLPLLDANLGEAEAAAMFEAMESAAQRLDLFAPKFEEPSGGTTDTIAG